MVIFIGLIVIMGGTITGFTIGGGKLSSLIHPAEVITLGGMALGAMIIMSPVKVLKQIVSVSISCLKGAPFKKSDFEDLLKVMYELFVLGRRNGMIALEEHVMNPGGSSLFKKYPSFHKNHAALEFFCDGLRPIVDGRIKPDQLEPLMDKSLDLIEHEKHAPPLVLSKIADALPGFGIVAAVLGIVITMGALGGDVSAVGGKIAAALTGTFMGVFLCYGVVGPMATNIEFYNHGEMTYLNCIKAAVVSFANGLPPLVAAEVGRRVLDEDMRPSASELETMLKTMGSK
ncbi:MAG: flagellar motor stator protein MotA [Verrucomicrobia bacterium]|nr:flagellar motor stator protein MotA [Verrucomicrobiota bacterium]